MALKFYWDDSEAQVSERDPDTGKMIAVDNGQRSLIVGDSKFVVYNPLLIEPGRGVKNRWYIKVLAGPKGNEVEIAGLTDQSWKRNNFAQDTVEKWVAAVSQVAPHMVENELKNDMIYTTCWPKSKKELAAHA